MILVDRNVSLVFNFDSFFGVCNILMLNCTDLDECASAASNDCAATAECINTIGSFTCSCVDGFIDTSPVDLGAGRICEGKMFFFL